MEHNINVLPKWARARIQELERRQVAISTDTPCSIIINVKGFNPKNPIHLSAGDTVYISKPVVKLEGNMNEDVRNQISGFINTNKAILNIEWRN